MPVLSQLEPKIVFDYFEKLCAIPHGSFHTKQISDYLVSFAAAHGLKYRQDEIGNVIIWKAATAGYENAPAVMIQGHMDMVAEKDAACTKDMEREGLDLFIDGDLIGAEGTTLGGDDGIAVAMGLAILDSDDIPHGPLECVFTVDEEVGMLGARALDTSDLKAGYLLNIDSEEEKVLMVSCAGACRAVCSFDAERETFSGEICKVTVTGLIGGHSGEEIQKGRGNSNILMGRVLYEMSKATELRLVRIDGGAKDNAIPRETVAVVSAKNSTALEAVAERLTAELQTEYRAADGDICVSVCADNTALLPLTKSCTQSVITLAHCAPNGVQEMSADVAGLVQTSLNLGRLYTQNDGVFFSFMVRSSVNSQKDAVASRLEALTAALGGKTEIASSYSAWQYRADSPLRDKMIEVFRKQYGEEPRIEALHAGLECGILSGKMPELDCISLGPDLTDIHTPRERLHIASTLRTWKLILATLKELRN